MSKARVFAICLSIFFFAAIAPALVLYAQGWRFDTTRSTFVQTGALYINTNVRGGSAITDRGIRKNMAPFSSDALIRNLLPGQTRVRIEKNGYIPWEKDVRIESQQTLRFINTLLRPEKPTTVEGIPQLNETIVDFSVSPDGTKIALLTKTGLARIWDRTKAIFLDIDIPDIPTAWSDDGASALIQQKNRALRISIAPDQTPPATIQGIQNVKFAGNDPLFVVGTIAQRNGATILASARYNPDVNTFTLKEIARNISAATISGKRIVFTDTGGTLWSILPDGNELLQLAASPVPNPSDIALIAHSENERAVAAQDKNGTIWIFSFEEKGWKRAGDNIHTAIFSPDADKLLMIAENELAVYFLTETHNPDHAAYSNELITRLSAPIQNAWWHHQNEHVLFTAAGELHMSELDGRGGRNDMLLAKDFISAFPIQKNELTALLMPDRIDFLANPALENFFGL